MTLNKFQRLVIIMEGTTITNKRLASSNSVGGRGEVYGTRVCLGGSLLYNGISCFTKNRVIMYVSSTIHKTKGTITGASFVVHASYYFIQLSISALLHPFGVYGSYRVSST